MSLTLPLMYFQTGADLSKLTHHEVHYQDGFVQQAWLQPEIQLFVVCIARKKGSRREIKGGMAVLTSIPASNGAELAKALDNVMRQSDELRPLAGKDENVFIPANIRNIVFVEGDAWNRGFHGDRAVVRRFAHLEAIHRDGEAARFLRKSRCRYEHQHHAKGKQDA